MTALANLPGLWERAANATPGTDDASETQRRVLQMCADHLREAVAAAPHPQQAPAQECAYPKCECAAEQRETCMADELNDLATPPAHGDGEGLNFEPDERHTVADMANVGYALMQAIARNRPDYVWSECPSEIVCDLINERDEIAVKAHGYMQELADVKATLTARPAPEADARDELAKLQFGWDERAADARRYQWLKNHLPPGTFGDFDVFNSATWDAAIDAAMSLPAQGREGDRG